MTPRYIPGFWSCLVLLLAALAACAPASDGRLDVGARRDTAEAIRRIADTLPWRWPADTLGYQLGNQDSPRLAVPTCRTTTPVVASDSIGPLRVGQTMAEVRRACPRSLRMWDWGDEGIPQPAALVRLGAMTVRIVFDSSAETSQTVYLFSADTAARTEQGAGPGTTLATLRGLYGEPTFGEAECVVAAWFERLPGVSFRLDLREQFECGEMEGQARRRTVTRATVAAVLLHSH